MKVKKLFSIDQTVDKLVTDLAKKEKRTRSAILEIALLFYRDKKDSFNQSKPKP